MSYIGSDVDQDNKPANLADFRRQRSSSNLMSKAAMESSKISQQQQLWNDKQNNDDTDSEISDSGHFLAKGAFLLTPSHELTMDRAAMICEKMNFKGCFSLTKTATGILFKFSHPEDYQSVFKKGFHKVTGARFYKKVSPHALAQLTLSLNLKRMKTGVESMAITKNPLRSLFRVVRKKLSRSMFLMFPMSCPRKISDIRFINSTQLWKLLDLLCCIKIQHQKALVVS